MLVLVSCDPASLGRDAKLLAAAGYRHERSEVVDTFPHTTHVEAVTRFTAGLSDASLIEPVVSPEVAAALAAGQSGRRAGVDDLLPPRAAVAGQRARRSARCLGGGPRRRRGAGA